MLQNLKKHLKKIPFVRKLKSLFIKHPTAIPRSALVREGQIKV
jgi:hypothetical protein